jgi:hypothetical protein
MPQPLNINELLPAALQGNLEPVAPSLRPPATIEGQQFELAIAEKKICHGSEEELKQALRYIYILVGLRAQNYPTDIAKQLLHAYIFEDYGGHTPGELRLAFKMAIQNKLSLRSEDVTCYENFSIAYFSRIMEAYREWAKEQIKQLPAPVQDRKLKPMEKVDINLIWALKLLSEINKLPVRVKL